MGDEMRRTKIIPIRLVQANHDTDWDGVPNFRDCQPLNPHKHSKDKMTVMFNPIDKDYYVEINGNRWRSNFPTSDAAHEYIKKYMKEHSRWHRTR